LKPSLNYRYFLPTNVFAILAEVKLKICEKCKRPFLAYEEFCPKCPRPVWNQESWINLGCLLAMILPVFIVTFLWLLFFFGLFIR
jgi:hypothetical protein